MTEQEVFLGVIGVVSLFVLIPLGLCLLWGVRLAFRGRGTAFPAFRELLTLAGWGLLLGGIMGTIVSGLTVLAPLGLLIVAVILLMGLSRYRTLERRSLLWSLSIAAAKGIPLEEAAWAFAEERPSSVGQRAARLAELLESGMPLPEAVAAARLSLPTDALVAVRVGCETGTLTPAMAQVARGDEELAVLLRSIFEKFAYMVLLVIVLLLLIAFLMLKIVPVFHKMFEEFMLKLPAITQAMIAVSQAAVTYGLVIWPLLLLVATALGIVGVLHYVGWLPRDVPLLNRFARRYDGSVVMANLALAVRREIPFGQMIEALSRLYPRSNIRASLGEVLLRIDGGEDWCESLRGARLIGQADTAVLKSAERVGNLAWALEEMADSSMRRLTYRLRLWLNILFPLTLLVFGLIVAFHVIGLFLPLVALIQGLA